VLVEKSQPRCFGPCREGTWRLFRNQYELLASGVTLGHFGSDFNHLCVD
jgi:hypothetical protein